MPGTAAGRLCCVPTRRIDLVFRLHERFYLFFVRVIFTCQSFHQALRPLGLVGVQQLRRRRCLLVLVEVQVNGRLRLIVGVRQLSDSQL
jgi:hypothetical protein